MSRTNTHPQCSKEKVSCEIGVLPSMMWKRSIEQVSGVRGRTLVALTTALLLGALPASRAADLVIEIPESGAGAGGEEGRYRLDYRPPHGSPAPNFTVPARASTINFQGLPGTKYHFMLYYSNATFADLLTWNQTIITAPEPPTNLTVTLGRNKQATISWAPPANGDYTGFRFKVVPLTERVEGGARNISVEGAGGWSHTLRDLAPGATYQLHAFTLLHDKESAAYASRNFTTKPNTPGKFIVWFRNETTLLVLWQPPYPPGFYTHYKVSIMPGDARESELYVEKEGEPPGPAQAAFKGLVPGRAYNISVQTVSEPEISAPTTAQYLTVPLRPRNVTVDDLTETSFRVSWLPPKEYSEFEKYQVSLAPAGGSGGGGSSGGGGGSAGARRSVLRARDEPPSATFEGLEAGSTYTLSVKTVSDKVSSWPTAVDVTLKPLQVEDLQWAPGGEEGAVRLWWRPQPASTQDEYRVSYHEVGEAGDDSNSISTTGTNVTLQGLLPGRNYYITVTSASRGVEGRGASVGAGTRPLAPLVASSQAPGAPLELRWRSDVTSRQDAYTLTCRATTRLPPHLPPHAYEYRMETRGTHAELRELYPGAAYELRVAARAHNLSSEPAVLHKPVRPLPATWMRIERATSNSVVVRWEGPGGGGFVGAFVLRYRTADDPRWTPLSLLAPNVTEAEIADMSHGERYLIQLDTLSDAAGAEGAGAGERAESGAPLQETHGVRPAPVSDVAPLVDTANVTLEWPRPKGRVDRYEVRATLLDPPEGEAAPPPALLTNVTLDAPEPGSEGGSVRAVVGGLYPGRPYRLDVVAVSYNLTSLPFTMTTRTRPLIQSEMTIVDHTEDDAAGAAFLQVTYTRTPAYVTEFDSYRFRLEGAGAPPRELSAPAAPDAPQRVRFDALVPGRLYNITMWTVAHNVTSHPVQRQARPKPLPIPYLNATQVGARSVSLAWSEPAGDWTEFTVLYLSDADTLERRNSSRPALTLDDLRPYTNYTFTVSVVAGTPSTILQKSSGVSDTFTTLEAPPAAPQALRPLDSRPSQVTLAWELPPPLHHGRLLHFTVEYRAHDSPDPPVQRDFPPEAREGKIVGLRAGSTYTFSVRGVNGAGAGDAATLTQAMSIAAPPRPAPHAVPVPVRATPTTIVVRFSSDYFSSANGNVTAYAVVVAEEAAAGAGSGRLPSWRDVHALRLWPPYQVTEPYYPFHGGDVEEFTIGSERCEGGGRAYCNGPLKPATKYHVKLRAYTAPDKYTDTEYAVIYTQVDNTAWIAVGAVCAACLVAAGVGAALWRRRRRTPAAAAAPPQPRASRPVRVVDFIDHYRLMSADSDFRFSEEFEELKSVGREQPCTAADLPCNRPKNRFTNILPYDHSRYKLQPVDDEEGSDYINANYVPGHNSPREFIVTQGPLHCTRDDFWRMCWESGSRAIVMLTRCVEKGREKCDRYWPVDTRPVYYGDICVTALNESRFPDWTVTELLAARGAEQRLLRHFHFTTWPDFGVPDPPTTLARFVRAFRERCVPDARPVIVHCSAGVGRSGTFITLDRALQQLAAGADQLDVFGMVASMRRERVWMVQTEQQYICVHQCLVAALEGRDLQPPPPPLPNHHLNPAFEDDEGIAESGM